jgi:hypothetical protein
MEPPASVPPGHGPAVVSPAAVAAALTRHLAAHGITDIYTATAEKFAVISVTAEVTVWTDGRQLWCTRHGRRHAWPAANMASAVAAITALACP